jgi:hypothetical protein
MAFLRRAPAPTGPPKPITAAPPGQNGRAAPEPLTLVLPALAALGAISSIAVVAWVAQDRTGDRPRVKRRIDVILKDLETSCLGLTEILRRIKRHGRLFGLDGPNGAAPLKLGLNGARMEPAAGQMYHQIVNDLATMLVLATQNSFDTINAIEDGEIVAPDSLFYGFAEAQEKLNVLISQRTGIRGTVDGACEVADHLTKLVQQLKKHKVAI